MQNILPKLCRKYL